MALGAEVLHAYNSAMLFSYICVALLEVFSFLTPVFCLQGKSSILFLFTFTRQIGLDFRETDTRRAW